MRVGTMCAMAAFALVWSAGQAEAKPPRVLILNYQSIGKGVPAELSEQTAVIVGEELKAAGIAVVRGNSTTVRAKARQRRSARRSRSRADRPRGQASAGKRADKLLKRAKFAVEEQEFRGAIRQFKQAIRLLNDNGDAIADLRVLSNAYLQLASAYFQDGDSDAAETALGLAVHYDPERLLSERIWPPVFIRVYNRVRGDVLRRSRAQIEVRAASGSQVLLDGRNLGRTPALLTDVLPGAHWLRIERPGEPVRVRKLTVRARDRLKADFQDSEGAGDAGASAVGAGLAQNRVDRELLGRLRAAARKSKADFVMFGGIHKTDTAYNIHTALLKSSDGSVGRLAPIAFDLDLLSAQIEVFKLAESAKAETAGSAFSKPADGGGFAMAPELKLRSASRRVVANRGGRMRTVAAAPPALSRRVAGRSQAFGGASGRALGPDRRKASLVPKDEEAGAVAIVTPPAPSLVDEDEEESLWWVWLIVGVAAAGAAGGIGGYLATSQEPDTAALRVTW